MKIAKNRLKVRRLFVLGAGASYASSVTRKGPTTKTTPLDKDFCKSITSEDYAKPVWWSDTVKEVVANWKDQRKIESYGLEEAIIRQLGYLEYFKAIHPRKARSMMSPQDYLSRMAHVIAFRLSKCRENRTGLYRELNEHLRFGGKNPDRVISFNYDDLLDRHLLKDHVPAVVYFNNIRESRNDTKVQATDQSDPLLLKLHGSLNWRIPNEALEHLLESETKINRLDPVWFDRKRSPPSVDDDQAPCIVPPLPAKPVSSISLFQFLWTKAAEYLHEAEELIICGYSLPEADRMAVSLFGSFDNKKLKRVVVADPDPTVLTKWRSVLGRKGLPTSVAWEWYPGFAECLRRLS